MLGYFIEMEYAQLGSLFRRNFIVKLMRNVKKPFHYVGCFANDISIILNVLPVN